LNILEFPKIAPLPLNWHNDKFPDSDKNWNQTISHNQDLLIDIIEKRKCKVIVEVGTFVGNTACTLARQPSVKKLYTVDNWSLNLQKINKKININTKKQFLSNVVHMKLQNKIIPIQGISWEVGKQFQKEGIKVDLVYIDAHHGRESVRKDINSWYPVADFLCGDDYGTPQHRVLTQVVNNQAKKLGKKVKFNIPFWWYE